LTHKSPQKGPIDIEKKYFKNLSSPSHQWIQKHQQEEAHEEGGKHKEPEEVPYAQKSMLQKLSYGSIFHHLRQKVLK
jgi:hypothetical protein